jgi:hypothetical protein
VVAVPQRIDLPGRKTLRGMATMRGHATANEHIAQNLRDALDRLHRDIEKVEIWAGALSAFLQPIPDFELPHEFVLRRESPESSKREH